MQDLQIYQWKQTILWACTVYTKDSTICVTCLYSWFLFCHTQEYFTLIYIDSHHNGGKKLLRWRKAHDKSHVVDRFSHERPGRKSAQGGLKLAMTVLVWGLYHVRHKATEAPHTETTFWQNITMREVNTKILSMNKFLESQWFSKGVWVFALKNRVVSYRKKQKFNLVSFICLQNYGFVVDILGHLG